VVAPVECAAMASYLPYEPMQQMLLPEALQDWLPEGHLAYFISDTVDGLDLQAMSYSHMLKTEAELKAQIAALLNKAHSADEAEKKNVLGFRQFSLRGLHRVQAECKLVCWR
jgi:hypothetical protein